MYGGKRSSVANLLNEDVKEHSIRKKLRIIGKEQKSQQQRKPERHEQER